MRGSEVCAAADPIALRRQGVLGQHLGSCGLAKPTHELAATDAAPRDALGSDGQQMQRAVYQGEERRVATAPAPPNVVSR
jgi:hypothetical protein